MLARDTPSLGSGERWSAPSQDRKLAVVVAGAPSPVLRALPASPLPRVSAGWALCALGPSIRGGGRATGRNDHGLSGENHTRLSPYGFQGTQRAVGEHPFPCQFPQLGGCPHASLQVVTGSSAWAGQMSPMSPRGLMGKAANNEHTGCVSQRWCILPVPKPRTRSGNTFF